MRPLSTICLSALLLSGTAALAQTTQSGIMSDAQIKQTLESQGYTNVRVTEHDKNHVDVTASKNGQTQKLAVDPRTGQSKPDTDKD